MIKKVNAIFIIILLLAICTGCNKETKAEKVANKTVETGVEKEESSEILNEEENKERGQNEEVQHESTVLDSERDKTNYFMAMEAYYRGIGVGTTEEQLVELLGEPVSIIDTPDDFATRTYVYEDAEYSFTPYGSIDQSENRLIIISVLASQYETIRGIRVGCILEEALSKFPQEQDYTKNDYGVFFGENTLDGHGGAIIGEQVILTSENLAPFVKMDVEDDIITKISYCLLYIH